MHGSPCCPADKEAWNKAREDINLKKLCRSIEKSTSTNQQKKLKSQLPVWTPRCAQFNNNHRAETDVLKPLRRLMFDIDEKGHTDEIMAKIRFDKQIEETKAFIGDFEVLMVEESVRRGTHVLVLPPKGMKANEAQGLFSQLIGLAVDPAVKNVAGCIYMVPEDHVKYISPRFYATEDIDIVANTEDNPEPVLKEPKQTGDYPEDYDGIPYPVLVEALAEQLGGVPAHGSRNNFIFSMACHLRYVCNDSQEWIRQVLPTYGEETERVARTIQSACNRSQSRNIPGIMQRALSVARSKVIAKNNAESGCNPLLSPTPPPMPERLPKLIELLVSKVPRDVSSSCSPGRVSSSRSPSAWSANTIYQ